MHALAPLALPLVRCELSLPFPSAKYDIPPSFILNDDQLSTITNQYDTTFYPNLSSPPLPFISAFCSFGGCGHRYYITFAFVHLCLLPNQYIFKSMFFSLTQHHLGLRLKQKLVKIKFFNLKIYFLYF
jgi:hypothetical protein